VFGSWSDVIIAVSSANVAMSVLSFSGTSAVKRVKINMWKGPCHSSVAGFPTRWPGFDPRSDHVGFVVDKMTAEQVFSEYYGFSCHFSFHQMIHTHLSFGAGTIGQLVADVPSGLSLAPPHEIKK
jgi:hypothetical protein